MTRCRSMKTEAMPRFFLSNHCDGFIDQNLEVYPLSVPEGGYITFTASAAVATNVRFRFEFQPYPKVDPAYDTASVLVDSTEAMEYTIEVPSQGENTFSSFLLYLVERDSPVTITNVVVSSYIPAQ